MSLSKPLNFNLLICHSMNSSPSHSSTMSRNKEKNSKNQTKENLYKNTLDTESQKREKKNERQKLISLIITTLHGKNQQLLCFSHLKVSISICEKKVGRFSHTLLTLFMELANKSFKLRKRDYTFLCLLFCKEKPFLMDYQQN